MYLSIKPILEQLTTKAAIDNDIAVIWLYGSQAKGTATKTSDIDLAVAFNNFALPDLDKRLRTETLALLWQQALNLNDNVISIVDINTAPSYLAFNIVEYGEVILCKDKIREFREIERVYSVYESEIISIRADDNIFTGKELK